MGTIKDTPVIGRPSANEQNNPKTDSPVCVLLTNSQSFQTVSTPIGWHLTCKCPCKPISN
jgi:hypothetical protein